MLGATVRDLRRAGASALVGILLTALAVFTTGSTLLGLAAFARLAAAWRADLRVVVVLREPPVRSDDPQSVVDAARALPGVATVRYVPSDAALAALRSYLGGAADGLDRLPANPVPARLEVVPAPTLNAEALRGLVSALSHLSGVEAVQAAIGWVEPAERLARGLRLGGFALAALLGLAALLAVMGGTRAARRSREDETAILRLAGVGEARLWAPLLIQATLVGLGGGVVGVAALFLVSAAGPAWVSTWLQSSLGLAPFPVPSGRLGAALLGGGLAAGLLGGLGGGRP